MDEEFLDRFVDFGGESTSGGGAFGSLEHPRSETGFTAGEATGSGDAMTRQKQLESLQLENQTIFQQLVAEISGQLANSGTYDSMVGVEPGSNDEEVCVFCICVWLIPPALLDSTRIAYRNSDDHSNAMPSAARSAFSSLVPSYHGGNGCTRVRNASFPAPKAVCCAASHSTARSSFLQDHASSFPALADDVPCASTWIIIGPQLNTYVWAILL